MSLPAVAADNRRAVERYPAHQGVGGHWGSAPPGRAPRSTWAIDWGGMGIVSDWNLPVGTPVVVKFNLPVKHTSAPLILNAVVVNGALAGSLGGFRVGFAVPAA